MDKPSRAAIPLNWLVGLCAIGCLWPLIVHRADFQALFFFEDEWDQIAQFDREGVWHWAVSVFGENFMPVGKLVWYAAIRLGNGSYFSSVVGVWLTHGLNVFLLGILLRRAGMGLGGIMLAVILFGYSATTYETLAWSIQWSNVLALTFFLGALLVFQHVEQQASEVKYTAQCALLALLALASALCFVRGIFSGLAIAGVLLLPGTPVKKWRRRLQLMVCLAAPAVLVLAFTRFQSAASASSAAELSAAKIVEMGRFALHCYARNPISVWLSRNEPGTAELVILVILKTAVLASGVLLAPKRLRTILVVLVLFELANDAALGVGRAHTGLGAAASSRYQYTSLFVFCPFLGVLFARCVDCLPRVAAVRLAATGVVLLSAGYGVAHRWPETIRWWKGWRGSELRAALAMPPETAPASFARLPWIPNERVRELVRKYHLH